MKKIIKIIIIGCTLLGLIFFIFLKNIKGTTPVLTLAKDINTGQIITENMVKVEQIPNNIVPKDIIKNKQNIIGKTLSVPRLKNDYIPKNIVKDVNIKLNDNEIVLTLRIPKDDIRLIQEGGEIALSLISGSTNEPLLVKGITVMAVNEMPSKESASPSDATDLVVVKTTELIGNKIAPFIKNNNYKVLVLPQDTNTSNHKIKS